MSQQANIFDKCSRYDEVGAPPATSSLSAAPAAAAAASASATTAFPAAALISSPPASAAPASASAPQRETLCVTAAAVARIQKLVPVTTIDAVDPGRESIDSSFFSASTAPRAVKILRVGGDQLVLTFSQQSAFDNPQPPQAVLLSEICVPSAGTKGRSNNGDVAQENKSVDSHNEKAEQLEEREEREGEEKKQLQEEQDRNADEDDGSGREIRCLRTFQCGECRYVVSIDANGYCLLWTGSSTARSAPAGSVLLQPPLPQLPAEGWCCDGVEVDGGIVLVVYGGGTGDIVAAQMTLKAHEDLASTPCIVSRLPKLHSNFVTDLRFLRHDLCVRLASCAADGIIIVWKTVNNSSGVWAYSPMAVLRGHIDLVRSVAWRTQSLSANASSRVSIVSAGNDRTLREFDVTSLISEDDEESEEEQTPAPPPPLVLSQTELAAKWRKCELDKLQGVTTTSITTTAAAPLSSLASSSAAAVSSTDSSSSSSTYIAVDLPIMRPTRDEARNFFKLIAKKENSVEELPVPAANTAIASLRQIEGGIHNLKLPPLISSPVRNVLCSSAGADLGTLCVDGELRLSQARSQSLSTGFNGGCAQAQEIDDGVFIVVGRRKGTNHSSIVLVKKEPRNLLMPRSTPHLDLDCHVTAMCCLSSYRLLVGTKGGSLRVYALFPPGAVAVSPVISTLHVGFLHLKSVITNNSFVLDLRESSRSSSALRGELMINFSEKLLQSSSSSSSSSSGSSALRSPFFLTGKTEALSLSPDRKRTVVFDPATGTLTQVSKQHRVWRNSDDDDDSLLLTSFFSIAKSRSKFNRKSPFGDHQQLEAIPVKRNASTEGWVYLLLWNCLGEARRCICTGGDRLLRELHEIGWPRATKCPVFAAWPDEDENVVTMYVDVASNHLVARRMTVTCDRGSLGSQPPEYRQLSSASAMLCALSPDANFAAVGLAAPDVAGSRDSQLQVFATAWEPAALGVVRWEPKTWPELRFENNIGSNISSSCLCFSDPVFASSKNNESSHSVLLAVGTTSGSVNLFIISFETDAVTRRFLRCSNVRAHGVFTCDQSRNIESLKFATQAAGDTSVLLAASFSGTSDIALLRLGPSVKANRDGLTQLSCVRVVLPIQRAAFSSMSPSIVRFVPCSPAASTSNMQQQHVFVVLDPCAERSQQIYMGVCIFTTDSCEMIVPPLVAVPLPTGTPWKAFTLVPPTTSETASGVNRILFGTLRVGVATATLHVHKETRELAVFYDSSRPGAVDISGRDIFCRINRFGDGAASGERELHLLRGNGILSFQEDVVLKLGLQQQPEINPVPSAAAAASGSNNDDD